MTSTLIITRHPGDGRGPAGGRRRISRAARRWTPACAGVTDNTSKIAL